VVRHSFFPIHLALDVKRGIQQVVLSRRAAGGPATPPQLDLPVL
jgi:hypothetical protein